MKNKYVFLFLVSFSSLLLSEEAKAQFGWLDVNECSVQEGFVLVPTCKGIASLKIYDFDAETNRYLVECMTFEGHVYPTPDPALQKPSS